MSYFDLARLQTSILERFLSKQAFIYSGTAEYSTTLLRVVAHSQAQQTVFIATL